MTLPFYLYKVQLGNQIKEILSQKFFDIIIGILLNGILLKFLSVFRILTAFLAFTKDIRTNNKAGKMFCKEHSIKGSIIILQQIELHDK